ncbi:MAG: tail fiber domain-containing protein [Acidobacteriota bacterium]|nr:MAG: tail fiber domain-containing protein [Acidobacteriota bacterium]
MKFAMKIVILFFGFVMIGTASASAQGTAFTFQGALNSGAAPAKGDFDLEFRLFDSSTDGSQIGPTVSKNAVAVSNGAFSVTLDFGDQFTGAQRFLEIRVRPSGQVGFTILSPRQPINSVPYAVRSTSSTTADSADTALFADTAATATNAESAATATTADNALQLGGTPANQFVLTTDPRLSDPRAPSPGSTDYVQNSTAQQASSNFNISGNGTAGGTLTGNVLNAGSEFRIAGSRVFSNGGNFNLFAGVGSGAISTGQGNAFFGFESGFSNTTGANNAFLGRIAGRTNTTGSSNTFVGSGAGFSNETGSANAFVGDSAGFNSTTGFQNVFFGTQAGSANSTGNSNSFFGTFAGNQNGTGTKNTAIGHSANVGTGDLTFATAIGANAVVSTSNTIALGRANGSDQVVIPGNLTVSGTLTAALPTGSANYIQNSTDQQASSNFNISGNGTAAGTLTGNVVKAQSFFSLGNDKILSSVGAGNLFLGLVAGSSNTIGVSNTFLGVAAGRFNTEGIFNTFVGGSAGQQTTTGSRNTFLGSGAGFENVSGFGNTFVGNEAGRLVTSGTDNTFIGLAAGNATAVGSANTFVGSLSGVLNTTGNFNSTLGRGADFGSGNLSFATAIGAGSVVSSSNTIALGRANGSDQVVIPGNLNVSGTLTAALPAGSGNYIQNSTAIQNSSNFNISGVGRAASFNAGFYSIANERVLFAEGGLVNNLFVGLGSGNPGFVTKNNTFVGISAGEGTVGGDNNTFVGMTAGQSNQTGNSNTFVGTSSGLANTTGSSNTLLGTATNLGSPALSFATAIGAGAIVNASNSVVLGRANGSDEVFVPGRLTVSTLGPAGSTSLCRNAGNEIAACSSSIRYKSNLSQFSNGLEIVSRLRPMTFTWKDSGIADLGLVAEEVAGIEPLLTTQNTEGQVEGVKYDRIAVVLVNAVNQQQRIIDQQETEIGRLRAELAALKALVCASNPGAAICRTPEN